MSVFNFLVDKKPRTKVLGHGCSCSHVCLELKQAWARFKFMLGQALAARHKLSGRQPCKATPFRKRISRAPSHDIFSDSSQHEPSSLWSMSILGASYLANLCAGVQASAGGGALQEADAPCLEFGKKIQTRNPCPAEPKQTDLGNITGVRVSVRRVS